MLSINQFDLKNSYAGSALSWAIDATASYEFTVKRSEAPSEFPSPALLSGDQVSDPSQYKDIYTRPGQKNRVWHYRLSVVEGGASEHRDVSSQGEAMAISRVILEKQATMLKPIFGGRLIRIYIRKTIGPRCSKCWDDRRSRRTKSNCTECYNTGITGGYYAAIEAQASFFPSPMMEQVGKFGVQVQNVPMLWISDFPEIKGGQESGDVVFDTMDRKYFRVQRVEKALLHQALTQKMILKQLRSQDIETSLGE
jgi:hypothetical protein